MANSYQRCLELDYWSRRRVRMATGDRRESYAPKYET
ncbi:hypothetical protein [Shewanella sp.]